MREKLFKNLKKINNTKIYLKTTNKRSMPLLGNLIKRGSTLRSKVELRKQSPLHIQQKTLLHLLRKASNTQFGRYYDFEKILKSKNPIHFFQQDIPLHDYSKMHTDWWHLSLKNVDRVTWRERIKYFALSSGTTGAPSKYLPISKSMLQSNNRVGFRILMSLANFDLDPEIYTKEKLMLGGSTSLLDTGNYFVGDLSGINASRLPSWIRWSYRPGKQIAKIKDWNQRIEMIAKEAPNWDIGFIMGIPSWIQLMIEKIIQYHQVDHIHQIWPNLKVFIHGGIAFEPYQKSFEKLLGKELIYVNTYLASEGFIAFQKRPNAGMELILDNGIFYEFIPFDQNNFDEFGNPKPSAITLNIDEVAENVDYALVISTNAGAWRYLIGDTIRLIDKSKSEIIITGRTKHFLSVCGEHLSVENMNQAIQSVEKDLNISIREFTVSYLPMGNSFKHKWYLGCDKQLDEDTLKEALDYHLKRLNADYETERNSLLGMEVVSLSTQLFYEWHSHLGKMGGQSKFPRVMQPKQFNDWECFVTKEKIERKK